MVLFKLKLNKLRKFLNHNFSMAWFKLFQNQFPVKQHRILEDVIADIPKQYRPLLKYLNKEGTINNDWIYVNNAKNLPKLPVPPLHQTIKKYEEKMKVILNEEEYTNLKSITKEFLEDDNLGPKLQNFLLDRQKKLDNWVYDYWLEDMYLAVNDPLPIYSSPALFQNIHPEDICCFATNLVGLAVIMEKLFELNIYPKRRNIKSRSVELCMDQYHKLFRSYRIPGKHKDTVRVFPTPEKNHIIVLHKNNFYYLPIKTTQDGINELEIYSSLKAILKKGKNHKSLPIGILTTLGRRVWWKKRNILMKHSINRSNLELIETALLIVCMDEPITENFSNINNDDGILLRLKHILHGGDVKENSGNRWFDKSAQLILTDSCVGFCIEHSVSEGVVGYNIMESLFKNALELSKLNSSKYHVIDVQIEKLKWFLETDLLESMDHAILKIDMLIKDLDLKVFTYNQYGSHFIKSLKYSPDGFVQLIFQLTYYKMYGQLCAAYESCSMRRFSKGRADCIRTSTPEAYEWVKEMLNSSSKNEFKLKLFENALRAQYKESNNVGLGQGVDLHLLGLREAAKEILDEIPKLFTDQSYSIANQFIISTSQLGILDNSYGCYGPVINNGYGIFYSIQDSNLQFSVSSFHSCTTTSTDTFLHILKESLCDVRRMIESIE